MRQCDDPSPRELLLAINQFNGGRWFECHETLEDLWVGEEGEMRDFYQGVLQVAVALHHWRNGNFGGAIRLLEGGASYLRRVRPDCQRVDVADLIVSADKFREELVILGPTRMEQLAQSLIPRLQLFA